MHSCYRNQKFETKIFYNALTNNPPALTMLITVHQFGKGKHTKTAWHLNLPMFSRGPCFPQLLEWVSSQKISQIIAPPGLNIRVQSPKSLRWMTLPMSHCCMKNRSWWILVGAPALFASLELLQVLDPRQLISSRCSLQWEQISSTVKGWREAV